MSKQPISTSSAPKAIGTYSQAIRAGDLVFLSGQIALHPVTGEMVQSSIEVEITQVFENLKAVAEASQLTLDHAVKVMVYLTDLSNFSAVNQIMTQFFKEPYAARAAVGVASLPRGARVEVDAVLFGRSLG